MVLSSLAQRRLVVGAVLAATSVAVSGVVAAQKGKGSPASHAPARAHLSKRVDELAERKKVSDAVLNYRHWRIVNPDPIWVPGPTAALCAAPVAVKGSSTGPQSPHANKWVRVFVNHAGEAAMLTQKVPDFPRGTIIVKEKLPEKGAPKAELLTVMAKRAAGYDTANGDWEYLAMSGDGTQVQSRGKLANCQACHIPQKENGYVFRDYLPEDVKKGLK